MKKYTRYIRYVFRILIFFIGLQLFAQRPVRVTTQLIPPYSVKLSDYATANSDRLVMNLVLGDVNEFNRQVILKLKIKGNGFEVRSSDVIMDANPISLDGGIPRRLTNIDLRPYFQLENLVGISPQQYSQPLPAGLYQFCFEVYDFLSGQILSMESCATAYIILNDPPFLNMPLRGENVAFKEPQNIVFQWTPRHINATNVEYEFTLAEIWDSRIDPQAAFLASRPLFQTTTRANMLLYGPSETPLLPGKTYGWQVKAVVTDGISELSLFKNGGNSEIYHFYYTGNCKEPQYVLAESNSHSFANVFWQGNGQERFRVQYRKKDGDHTKWYEVDAYTETAKIRRLQEQTTYEYRVGGKCGENNAFTYSRVFEFTTTTRGGSDFSCGVTSEPNIDNQTPLSNIGTNEEFTAGEFPVTVKQVQGSNGTFSGWGYITVPYLSDTRIRVSFNQIRINEDHQLLDGILITDYDPTWSGIYDATDDINALLSLGDAIAEALNLDLSRTTKERVGQIVTTIVEELDNEGLPDGIQEDMKEAANQIQSASSEYFDAKEEYENAETDEEKEAAKKKMETAETNVEAGKTKLKKADKDAEKYKEKVSDLLKKAIIALYREGKDLTNSLFTSVSEKVEVYEPLFLNDVNDTSETVVEDYEVAFIDNSSTSANNKVVEFYKEDLELGMYLFAELLSNPELSNEVFESFISESKQSSIDYLETIKTGISENKRDDEIITELKDQLRQAFTKLLVKYNYQ